MANEVNEALKKLPRIPSQGDETTTNPTGQINMNT
jgi:hypothetical protein